MSSLESDQNDLVKYSLLTFLESNQISDGECQISIIDEIVLSYVTNVLEDLGVDQKNYEEQFDVEEFAEIMGAYFPGFANIERSQVCEWIFKLADQLARMRSNGEDDSSASTKFHFNLTVNTELCQNTANLNRSQCTSSSSPLSPQTLSLSNSLSSSPATKYSKSSESNGHGEFAGRNLSRVCKKNPQIYEREHKSSLSDKDDCDDFDDKDRLDLEIDKDIEILQEMFPNVSLLEVTHCLSVVGDTERAAQLIMHRLESKESLTSTSIQLCVGKIRSAPQNDKDLKAHILSRYAFVDKADDERDHKPVAPKTQPKKLIRYRDNKIVSIKGEKFTELNGEND